jgi:hypothetical protein
MLLYDLDSLKSVEISLCPNIDQFSGMCSIKIPPDMAKYQLHTPVILATWKAEIRRITVPGQSGQTVHETPHLQNNQSKMNWKHDSGSRVLCSMKTSNYSPTKKI